MVGKFGTMNNKIRKREIRFYLNVGVFQLVLYGAFYALSYSEYVTYGYKIIMPALSLVFCFISIFVTVLMPILLIYRKKKEFK